MSINYRGKKECLPPVGFAKTSITIVPKRSINSEDIFESCCLGASFLFSSCLRRIAPKKLLHFETKNYNFLSIFLIWNGVFSMKIAFNTSNFDVVR